MGNGPQGPGKVDAEARHEAASLLARECVRQRAEARDSDAHTCRRAQSNAIPGSQRADVTSGPSQRSGKQSATCGLGGTPPARRRKAARTKPGTAKPSDQPGTAGHAACDSADAHGPTQAEWRSWTAEQGPPRARCLLGATAVATLRRQTGASELHIEKWLNWQALCEMCFPKNKNKKPKMRCEGYIFKTKKGSDLFPRGTR